MVTLAKSTFGCFGNPTLHANVADSDSFNPMFALGLQHPSMAMLYLALTRPTPTLVCISKPAPQAEAKFVMARNNTYHVTSLPPFIAAATTEEVSAIITQQSTGCGVGLTQHRAAAAEKELNICSLQ